MPESHDRDQARGARAAEDGLEPATGPSEAGIEPAGAATPEGERPDPEVEARRAAALSLIRRFGDPVLRSRATSVDRFDEALRAQVARMGGLLGDALGVGLAAPQVGISQRLLVYRLGHEAPLIALVNPEIEWQSEDRETLEEGCLSIPAVHLDVERPVHVRVRAVDEAGADRLVEASGLEARVIQHEVDHLDGVLILDRVSREERKEAMRAVREAEREREAA
jgi:peptide deformylase